jgi:hypothetical protein
VERCIVQQLRRVVFTRPRGGEAEFTYALNFQSKITPAGRDPELVKQEIVEKADSLFIFHDGSSEVSLKIPRGLTITFYINHEGEILSAGMNAEEPIDEQFAERFIQNLKSLKLAPPTAAYAKASYSW